MNGLRFIAICLLFAIVSPCFGATEGERAPEFKAKLFDGESFSLADVPGQVVILHFWATWCAACQTEMPILNNYYKQHHAEGIRLIAISMDSAKDETKAKDFMKNFSFSGGMSKDASFKPYGRIWRLPLTFIVDRKGILRKDGWVQDRAMTLEDLETIVTPLLKANAQAEVHRPFEEMKGGCDKFSLDLKKEFALWDKSATKLQAGSSGVKLPTIPLGTKTSLTLEPEFRVKWVSKPEKTFPVPKTPFGGLMAFSPGETGVFRFVLGNKVWLDVVDLETGKPVQAKHFEMQTGCDKIFKVIEYELTAGRKCAVQISSSPEDRAQLLIQKSEF